jgi:MFS family permease
MMNVEAAAVEQAFGKTLMPLFHAFFSLGTVAGAGIGVAMAAWGVGVAWHLGAVASLRHRLHGRAAVRPRTRRRRRRASRGLARRAPARRARGVARSAHLRDRGDHPRHGLRRGSANDWLTIAVVDGHHESEATGAIFLTVFSVAMTVFRALGGPLVDRIGRVWTLRARR